MRLVPAAELPLRLFSAGMPTLNNGDPATGLDGGLARGLLAKGPGKSVCWRLGRASNPSTLFCCGDAAIADAVPTLLLLGPAANVAPGCVLAVSKVPPVVQSC
jgi:hypothetical protein